MKKLVQFIIKNMTKEELSACLNTLLCIIIYSRSMLIQVNGITLIPYLITASYEYDS
jgi:hypothetical protein